jgi:hypothetical protein
MPHIASIVDDISFVRSMHSTQFNHGPAQIFQSTGFQIIGQPSFGSWVTYGIGSESKDLPAFVVLLSGDSQPDGGGACWGSGFLPTMYQGVQFRKQGDPVMFRVQPGGSIGRDATPIAGSNPEVERDRTEGYFGTTPGQPSYANNCPSLED